MTGRRVAVELNKRGEQLPQSKLTDADVRLIRALHEQGVPTSQIAKKFEISQSSAWRVCNYETWRHVA